MANGYQRNQANKIAKSVQDICAKRSYGSIWNDPVFRLSYIFIFGMCKYLTRLRTAADRVSDAAKSMTQQIRSQKL